MGAVNLITGDSDGGGGGSGVGKRGSQKSKEVRGGYFEQSITRAG